jgi:hypothetical protein
MVIYKDPRKPNRKPKGRYHGNSPTYRRNQTGDYSSNADRYEKAIDLVPGLIDQNNPYLFASGEADDGYWRVFIVNLTCRDNCGGCTGDTGKILVHPGERPLRTSLVLGPGLPLSEGYYIQLHKWDQVPTSSEDLNLYRKWYADLPYNSVISLKPGIWSVSARNPSGNYWDTVCLGFGQIAQASLTVELVSYN